MSYAIEEVEAAMDEPSSDAARALSDLIRDLERALEVMESHDSGLLLAIDIAREHLLRCIATSRRGYLT